jgi:hypothetical protein
MAIVFELEIGGFFHQTYKIYISDRGEEGDAFSRLKLIFSLHSMEQQIFWRHHTQHNGLIFDTQHGSIASVMLSAVLLSVVAPSLNI